MRSPCNSAVAIADIQLSALSLLTPMGWPTRSHLFQQSETVADMFVGYTGMLLPD